MKCSEGDDCVRILLLSLAITAAFAALSCSEEKLKPSVTSIGIGQDAPTQESWNATITFTDGGKTTAILRAGYISRFAERRSTILDSSITVDFFDDGERRTSVLTAERGKVDDATHDFEARDNVVVVSSDSTILKTDLLYWNNTTQKVHTTAYVEITSPTEQIRGHGFESDKGLKRYTIFRVTGQATTKQE